MVSVSERLAASVVELEAEEVTVVNVETQQYSTKPTRTCMCMC